MKIVHFSEKSVNLRQTTKLHNTEARKISHNDKVYMETAFETFKRRDAVCALINVVIITGSC